MPSALLTALLLLLLSTLTRAAGVSLKVELPSELKPVTAVATAASVKQDATARIEGTTLSFTSLVPDTPYDVKVTLDNGKVLQGVDLDWYDEEPPKPDAADMSDDDRKEIKAIVNVPSFYNKSGILFYKGSHDRAVVLVRLIRDNGFVNNSGGEVIWRIELWYFRNQFGGWEKVANQNKVLRRERFKTPDAFKAEAGKIEWVPSLGGLQVGKDEKEKTVKAELMEK